MLPNNFTFYIGGRYDLKYFSDKQINYFIGFNHPGQIDDEKYSYENVSKILGDIEYFCAYEVHDAFTEEHRIMGCKMPDQDLIVNIIDTAIVIKEFLSRGEQINLAICCAAGISRSTAATYIILCYLLGEWHERDALALVENKRSIARPNPLMVKLADNLLGRNFKMVAPLKNHLDLEKDDDILLF
jgi:predicted protein tyrosine phosphatase